MVIIDMKKQISILIAMMIFIISGISFAIDINNEGYVEAEGVVYPEPGESLNDMRRTVVLEAYRYLAEEVDNLQISSTTTVKKSRRVDDEINTKVESAVRGAKVTSVYRDNDGAFHAVVRLPIYGSNSLAGAVLTEHSQVEDFPKPKFTTIEIGDLDKNYTGLIVDCRGLNISTAISPSIKSESGEEIYAYKQIAYQTAVNKGMVEYSKSIDSGVERAGSNPLIIKAVKVSGECDAVISQADSDKVLLANQTGKFLNDCMVVFVR